MRVIFGLVAALSETLTGDLEMSKTVEVIKVRVNEMTKIYQLSYNSISIQASSETPGDVNNNVAP